MASITRRASDKLAQFSYTKKMTAKIHSSVGLALVELTMIILLIGLLATIAIPITGSVRSAPQEGVAKRMLRNVYASAQAYYVTNSSFSGLSTADLAQDIPGVILGNTGKLTPGSHADIKEIAYNTSYADMDGQGVILCNASRGRYAYCLYQSGDSELQYGKSSTDITEAMKRAVANLGW